jgi:hypothetical protein
VKLLLWLVEEGVLEEMLSGDVRDTMFIVHDSWGNVVGSKSIVSQPLILAGLISP